MSAHGFQITLTTKTMQECIAQITENNMTISQNPALALAVASELKVMNVRGTTLHLCMGDQAETDPPAWLTVQGMTAPSTAPLTIANVRDSVDDLAAKALASPPLALGNSAGLAEEKKLGTPLSRWDHEGGGPGEDHRMPIRTGF